ncbi:MAG: NAD-dependent epimerase/dehydratase family protein [Fusobacteriaceae bacterium]|nr:NAD-dependent epimerase/dehydratase family protein [Fusobacteriaceae bacterium]
MRILLIGGSGFIGSNLAETLVNAGFEVIVLDIVEGICSNLKFIGDKIKIYKGQYSDIELLKEIFVKNNISIVVNLVTTVLPDTTLENLDRCIHENITANIKLFRIMKKYQVNKYVYFSSGGTVYGNNGKTINNELDITRPINYYGWIKNSVENLIMVESNLNDLEYLIVRPSNPYGKYQNIYGNQGLIAVLFGKVIKGKPIEIWGDGQTIRDYIFIEDLTNYVLKLIQNNCWNDIYNIGSGEGYSVNEIIEKIEKITDKKIEVIYKEKRNVDIDKNILDVEKINKIKISNRLHTIGEGLEKTWSFLKKEQGIGVK